MRFGLLWAFLLLIGACTEAPKDPRVASNSSTAESSGQSTETTPRGDVTSEQVLEALAKMDNSTVKVSGTAGGVRIETDGSNTKTIPSKSQQVGGTGITKTISANGEHIIIDGSSNTIKIRGRVGLLEVTGSDHKVYVQSAEQIEVKGSGSVVYWAKKYNGKEPKVFGQNTASVKQGAFPR